MQPKLAVLGLLLAIASASSAKAQATIDVSKITCDQYVHSKISTPNYIAAWLSGYITRSVITGLSTPRPSRIM